MSKIHVFDRQNWCYSVVLHTPTPPGNNLADKGWNDILIAIGAETNMTVGTGPGQISQVEADSIAVGNTMEISTSILAESGGMTLASLDEMADRIIQDKKQWLQLKYKYYGYIQE